MNRKIERLLKSFLVVILVCGIFVFSIVSLNSNHIEVCQNSHCSLCSAIDFSQKVVMILMVTIITFSVILFLVSFFLAEFYEEIHNEIVILNTLVYRKIQLNE